MEFMQEEVSSSRARGRRSLVDNGTENPKSRWREIIFGSYNWRFLCTPRVVFGGKRDLPPFYKKDEDLPLLLAAAMGLQHALAMVGGIITPPVLTARSAGFSAESQSYLVSAALIVSAFASFIQILQIKIPFTPYVIGSGLFSVMGITFAVVPVAKQVISFLTSCTCNGVSCLVHGSCNSCQQLEGKCLSGEDAYGHVLGTIIVCCWIQVVISFCPPRILPVVTGTSVILIGVSLIATGFEYWGGGSYCASQGLHYNSSTHTISGMAKSTYQNGTICVQQCSPSTCNDIICHHYRYVTGTKIANANWATFLWMHTFPLKFYAPAIFPLVFVFITATMECIGDVTATVEASLLEPFGPSFEKSIQGAILADGLNTFLAALGTMIPVTTYAQNNGVISLSRCASRRAGYACCIWLLVLGVFLKFAAILVSVPDCVLGGMTTFLFASVVVSGIRVLNLKEGLARRNKFIVIIALGIGLGVNLVPSWVNTSGQANYPFEGNLWPVNPGWSPSYRGFRDAIILILSNGFSVGGLLALILNLILPFDNDKKELPVPNSK